MVKNASYALAFEVLCYDTIQNVKVKIWCANWIWIGLTYW